MGHLEKIVASIVLSFHFFEERLTGRRPFKTLIDFLSFDQGVASGVVAGRFRNQVELSCASLLWKIVQATVISRKLLQNPIPVHIFHTPYKPTKPRWM